LFTTIAGSAGQKNGSNSHQYQLGNSNGVSSWGAKLGSTGLLGAEDENYKPIDIFGKKNMLLTLGIRSAIVNDRNDSCSPLHVLVFANTAGINQNAANKDQLTAKEESDPAHGSSGDVAESHPAQTLANESTQNSRHGSAVHGKTTSSSENITEIDRWDGMLQP